ncbi:DUF2513 domain-containing protein [Paenisporosarcina sp. OV554]|uniref:DUF2513 domain-containing protein n=1 Tax=Paenisporosarcina sp. OV554 TaxID=2135694 RepID=UPI001304F386|nr:DUF2513 domain-containing protein [Paenisporosarcina sp. OV554]
MKRDLNLVRELFLIIESNDGNSELKLPVEWDRENVAYHLKIMDQAGYINNNTKWAGDRPFWIYASLTWEGHEFLDSIKNDTIWDKTKEGIKKKGFELGSVPLAVIKEYATMQIKNVFGLS